MGVYQNANFATLPSRCVRIGQMQYTKDEAKGVYCCK